MNSRGIQPRVGMQVLKAWCTGPERKRISSVSRNGELRFDNGGSASVEFFKEGYYVIEWIPPTDEERVMLANLKTHPAEFEHSPGFEFLSNLYANGAKGAYAFTCFTDCNENCSMCNKSWKEIAESLALDGMDIEDVSKIEELMR